MSLDPSQRYSYGGDEYQQQQQQQPQAQAQAPPPHRPPAQQPTQDPDHNRPPPHILTQQYPQPNAPTNSYIEDPTMTWQMYHSPAQAPPSLQPPRSRWPTHLSITLPQNIVVGPSTTSPMSMPYSAAHSSTSPMPGFTPYYSGSPYPSPALPQVISPGVHSTFSSSLSQPSPPLQEYFPGHQNPPSYHPPLVTPASTSSATSPSKQKPGSSRSTSLGSQGRAVVKTTRQQYTACGACKHRRVGCDLKDKQAAAEREIKKGGRRSKVSCSNCITRGINCVDEFAPVKAAKQLRRGKRISEIEHLFGMTEGVANPDSSFEADSPGKYESNLPELSQGFWQSTWLQAFVQQRPLVDLAQPSSDSLLHHALYASALSCGIDENGSPDLDNVVSPMEATAEYKSQLRRQANSDRLKSVLEGILREADSSGALRRPQWDTTRALLLLLPLVTEYLPPFEAQAIHDATFSLVFILIQDRLNGSETFPRAHLAELKTLWYAYTLDGLPSCLEGRRLHLDYTLVERFGSLAKPTAPNAMEFMTSRKIVAPNLTASRASRLLRPFLDNSQYSMSNETFTQITELLERGWHGAEMLSYDQSIASDVSLALGHRLDLFVVYNSLYTVLQNHLSRSGSLGREEERLRQLVDSAQGKCSTLSKVLVDLLRGVPSILSYGSSTFEDAIYHTGKWLSQYGGSAEDVELCLSLLSDSPWCLSKACSRIAALRDDLSRRSGPSMQQWSASPSMSLSSTNPFIHPPMLLTTPVKTEVNDTPGMGYPAQQNQQTQAFYYQSYNQSGGSAPYARPFWQPSQGAKPRKAPPGDVMM